MTKHYCDKCGKELAPGIKTNVKIGLWRKCKDDDGKKWETWNVLNHDICQECALEIEMFISGVDASVIY